MQQTQVPNVLAEAQAAFDSALTRQQQAEAELGWRRKTKAPAFLIEKAAQHVEAATREVEAARQRVEQEQRALGSAEQAVIIARNRHAELFRLIPKGEHDLGEHFLAIAKLFLRLQNHQMEAGRVNEAYRTSCTTLGLPAQDLPGIPALHTLPQDTFWTFLKRYLLQVQSGSTLHDGKLLYDTIYHLQEAARR